MTKLVQSLSGRLRVHTRSVWRKEVGEQLQGAGVTSDGEDGVQQGLGQGAGVMCKDLRVPQGEMVGEVVQAVSIHTSLRRWALKGWRGT